MHIQRLCQQHIGRAVTVHSRYGVHHGVLHHIDQNGMYLQLMQQRGGQMVAGEANVEAVTLDEMSSSLDAKQVFFPFFFIPFAAALALSPLWWGGYGYGGYGYGPYGRW
jgi:hypothetical protein